MHNFSQKLLLLSLFLFSIVQPTHSQQVIDTISLTLNELKGYLLKTSNTAEKLLPLLIKEGLISKHEYDSIVLDNNDLKLLLNSNVTVDSIYLSQMSYAYTTIEEFIYYVNDRKDLLANASKKLRRKIKKHITTVRQAEAAINLYNEGTESVRPLRFGIYSVKRLEPI